MLTDSNVMEDEDQLLLDLIMNKTTHDYDELSSLPWDDENISGEERQALSKNKCNNSWKSFSEFLKRKRGKIFIILSAVLLAVGDTISVVVIKETRNPFGVILATKMTVSVSCIFKLCYTKTPVIETFREGKLSLTIRGFIGGNAITLQLLAYNFISLAAETTIKSTLIFVSGLVGWIILAERITVIELIMAIFCVIGVTIIAKPFTIFAINSTNENGDKLKRDFFLVTIGVLISLGDAVCSGTAVVLSRLLNKRGIDTDVIILCGVLYSLPIDIACCAFTHQSPFVFTFLQCFYLLSCGLFRYAAFFFSTLLCLYEKSTISSLVFPASAVLEFPLQMLVLETIPMWNDFLGAGLIIPCMVAAVLVKSEENILSSQE